MSFLPRDAMRKRGLCCRPVSVRPSVCPSVTLVYRINTAEDVVNFFYRPGRIIILVFDSQRQYPISRETPPAWAQNTRVIAIFDLNRRLYRRRYDTGSGLLWNVNRKS